MKLATTVHRAPSGPFATLRAGAHPDKVRLVVEDAGLDGRVELLARAGFAGRLARQPVRRRSRGGGGTAAKRGSRRAGSRTARWRSTAEWSLPATAAARGTAGWPTSLDLGFVESSRGGRIQIKLNRPARFEVERPDDRSAVLTLDRRAPRPSAWSAASTPARWTRRSRWSAPSPCRATGNGCGWWSPPTGRSSERAERPATARLAPQAKGAEDGGGGGVASAPPASPPSRRSSPPRAPRQRRATSGKKVSFEFKDIDIHNLLRVIAEVSQEEHRRRRRREREDHHPPPQRALGPGAGPHPAPEGPGQGRDRQHHPRGAAEGAGGGGRACASERKKALRRQEELLGPAHPGELRRRRRRWRRG